MAFRQIRHAVLSMALLAIVGAQESSNIVPTDLQLGFGGDKQVQVSFTGEAINGFRDGTTFEKDAVAQEPTFALGDSSGISSSTLYTIIMVDTTCPTARTLHYARPNFKYNFDVTNINSSSAALLDYKPPASFGETGDNRQYSFLMYTNPGFKQIADLTLPNEGDPFDVKKFQDDNGLPDASAGVGMVVKLGGQANCEGSEQANTLPASLPTPRPARSTTGVGGTVTNDATPTAPTGSGNQSGNGTSGRGNSTPIVTSTINLATALPSGTATSSANLPEQTGGAGSRAMAGNFWILASLVAVAFW